MPHLPPYFAALFAPVTRLFDMSEQTWWGSYAGAALLAAGFYLWSRRRRKTSVRGLLRYLWPRRLLARASTRLDIKMYVFSSLYLAFQALIVFGGMEGLSGLILGVVRPVIGPGAAAHPLSVWAVVAVPLVIYLALEFGYWLSHYMLHHVGWMWEFHKVHHSAEVLTPLVEWRQHPFEYFLVPFVMGTVSSVVLAAVRWLFGPELHYAGLWSPSLIIMVFVCTTLHLRHSHVKMSAPGVLGYILQTPAHHQIHHSTDSKHFDKNLGFCLSLWDWVFGTLYIPKKDEVLTLGLYDDHGAKDELVTSTSLVRHLVLPFRRIWARQGTVEQQQPAE